MDKEKDGKSCWCVASKFAPGCSKVTLLCSRFSDRHPYQQPQRDQPAAEAEALQHCGAERGGGWQPAGEVSYALQHTPLCNHLIYS